MAIKLGKNPKRFNREIPLVTVDNVTEILVITYIYRSRLEFAKLIDERTAIEKAATAKAEAEAVAAKEAGTAPLEKTIAQGFIEASKSAAEQVLQIASGWDLVDPFTMENLQALEDDFPGSLLAIQDAYQKATIEVRVKNS